MSEKTDYGHWIGPEFDPKDYFGFVYVITNTVNNRKYIGQKQLHSTLKRPPLKGKVNKRHSKRESSWREYTGSSKALNEDIELLGKDKFIFEIVQLHQSKWELSYGEYGLIIHEHAIPSKKYYNEFLGRVGRPSEKAKEKYNN